MSFINKEKIFNGFYNYTVILTYLNMLSGFMGIISLLKGNVWLATLFLLIAGILDMMDGAVASTRKRTPAEKRFGIQIDSLSDLICFGAFPALFTFVICGMHTIALICALAYVLCALIRLAYFNVTEEERQDVEKGKRKYYLGLPVTMSSLTFPVFYMICDLTPVKPLWIFPAVTAIMAFAFLFAFKLTKPKLVGCIIMGTIGLTEFITLIVLHIVRG